MRRRDVLSGALGALAFWPLGARAQQAPMPVIGFLHSGAPEQYVRRLAAFRKGLSEQGFVEGQSVVIEYRWAAGQNDTLPAMVADLIRHNVALIATPGSSPATLVAKAATTTVPIVFAIGTDPVALGLVASTNHPGGNLTGITSVNAELAAKRLGVLRDLVPRATRFCTLVNPDSALTEPFIRELQAAAVALAIDLEVLRAGNEGEVASVFAALGQRPGAALVFPPDSFFYTRRAQIGALALRHNVPAIFDVRDYVDLGGLASYGTDFLNVMQLAGNYAGRILKGEIRPTSRFSRRPSSKWSST